MTGHEPPEAKPGRFRLASDHETEGPWSYRDNPFVGTRELHGLIAANLLLNNWDLAASNNRIYEIEGRRLYVAQDLGGSLGKTRWPIGTRNRIDDFESQGYIRGIENGRPDFDYYGRHRGIVRKVTAEDVAWVCGLLAKLTDRQLADAFRAAHYPQDVAERYVRKIEEKIREGVALGAAGSR
jgi:hypothetical protein